MEDKNSHRWELRDGTWVYLAPEAPRPRPKPEPEPEPEKSED